MRKLIDLSSKSKSVSQQGGQQSFILGDQTMIDKKRGIERSKSGSADSHAASQIGHGSDEIEKYQCMLTIY